ncbi:MAG: deoxynucleoside kinase, partial [Terriglobales bacterium]
MPELFEPPRYIAIEGPIRVGKSTLAQILAERMGARRLLEPDANPFLEDFYAGKPGAAFRTQMHFLCQRYKQMHGQHTRRPLDPIVADYIFEKDKIFAYVNLNDGELAVYNQYYDLFRPEVGTPDLVIYLQASPEVLKERVAKKNLPAEQQLSDEYIEEVVKAYDHFFFHYSLSDLLVINTSEIDFVERSADLQELLRRLAEPVRGTQFFLPLGE